MFTYLVRTTTDTTIKSGVWLKVTHLTAWWGFPDLKNGETSCRVVFALHSHKQPWASVLKNGGLDLKLEKIFASEYRRSTFEST